jgi:DNA (cytosine-5)-methyltransferase 1
MSRPILLDLFCGAGGAAMGYHRAGFDVVGVDINPQPHFPFEFIQADWEEPLWTLPGLWEREGRPYAIHASPPCQRYSSMTKRWDRSEDHPDLIAPVREHLEAIGVPYVIENVEGAPLWGPLMLCGTMFGLRSGEYTLRRHRLFEAGGGWSLDWAPAPCAHTGLALPVYGHAGGKSKRDGLTFPGTDAWREGMGIDWMTGKELAESIPPAYTEFVGARLLAALRADDVVMISTMSGFLDWIEAGAKGSSVYDDPPLDHTEDFSADEPTAWAQEARP